MRANSDRRSAFWLNAVQAAAYWIVFAVTAFAEDIDFDRDVAPILISRCLECHGPRDSSGGLNLTTSERLWEGGESGPSVVRNASTQSELWLKVDSGVMPPPRQGRSQKLPADEIAVLKRWIDAGAKWPDGRTLNLFERTTKTRAGRDWWSLQPITRPAVPKQVGTGSGSYESNNPIDLFIAKKLVEKNLTPAPPADPKTLLRRLFIDLVGYPPTAEELARFANDPSDQAYQKWVDQLLASPQFGVRWGRYWLDLVRYADTSGYERDQEKKLAWRYRDWVVDAINQDMPIDEFIRLQLCGDEIDTKSESTLIATGILRLGTWNDEPNDPEEYQYERLEDLVNVTSSAFLGQSVKCARCHDHKFDPISQDDYYRVASAFWPGSIASRSSDLLGGPSKEELGSEVLGWTDITKTPRPLMVFKSGEITHPLYEVEPGTPSFLAHLHRPFEAADPNASTTRRRRQLADWILDEANPLTARVFVNRLWQHHFGFGIVRSPSNFGFTGEPPTHPELLDYLASELRSRDWDAKSIHRMILLSRTYRQASIHPRQAEYERVDAANLAWWKAERRRIDAEALRDQLLQSADLLQFRVGGPGFKPPLPAEVTEGLSMKANAWSPSPESEQTRRSLYIYAQRSLAVPLMSTFDACDTAQSCPQRDVTTVAPQSLAMLNNELIHDPCQKLARQILGEEVDQAEAITSAWQRILGRTPTSHERHTAIEFVQRQSQRLVEQAKLPSEEIRDFVWPTESLAIHLEAESGVAIDEKGRVSQWEDRSSHHHRVFQDQVDLRPLLVPASGSSAASIEFDGQQQYFDVSGALLDQQAATFITVIRDRFPSRPEGRPHREILSNWSGRDGNSTTSLFFGMTGEQQVRVSDDYVTPANPMPNADWQLLAVVVGMHDVRVFRNGQMVAQKSAPLSPRKLSTPWVIGQQGNIQGEYWFGSIARIALWNRELNQDELESVQRRWASDFGINARPVVTYQPEELALAALIQVLISSNEFLYVD